MYGCMDDDQTERMLELMEERNEQLQRIESQLRSVEKTMRQLTR